MTLMDEMLDADDLSDYMVHDPIKTAISAETIRRLSPRKPITLPPSATLQDAIELMQAKRIGAVVVVEDNQPVGIFTERDVLFKVLKAAPDFQQTPLKDFMTPNPVSLFIEDKIAFALNRMTVGGFRHIPIVDHDGVLSGIISVKDIVEYLAGLFPAEVYNIRPEPLRGGFGSAEGG
jgi:CBS domain-containing protein